MTSLEAVSTYLPAESAPIAPYLEMHGLSSTQIKLYQRFYGFDRVLKEPSASLADLMLFAAVKLEALRGQEHQVRLVIHARTIQLALPYPGNPLDQVRRKLGLEHAMTFALTQHGCASGLLAFELSGRMLAVDDDPDALALVFAGEKALAPSTRLLLDSAVMGEGIAAFLVRSGGTRDRVLGYATLTHGRFNTAPWLSPEQNADFHKIYSDALADVLLAAVDKAGVALDDVRLVLPHNVNRISWMRVSSKIGLPLERIYLDNISRMGHCYCADPYINYQAARELGLLRPGDLFLMASVGLGATFSAMVLQH